MSFYGTYKPKMRVLTDEQRARFMAAIATAHQYQHADLVLEERALFTLLFILGPRISEALAMKWDDINWDRGELTLPTLKQYETVNGLRRKKLASRTLPMPAEVLEALRAHRDRVAQEPDFVFPASNRHAG